MSVRLILFTGKGGVGKTSVAAGTALASSKRGMRTLVTSTDPAHSLADCFGEEVGAAPREIAPALFAEQIDTLAEMEESWREIHSYAAELLAWCGVEGLEAEELAVFPGIDEIVALASLRRRWDSGLYDVLIVDCAPTAETIRLLSLPDVMTRYLERIFPLERRVARAARPVLGRFKGIPPIASDSVYAAIARFHGRLLGVKEILSDPGAASVRIVLNPEKMVIAEARRTYTYLRLFGYAVDAVVVNRILPEEVADPYFDRWKRIQAGHMRTIEESFAPLPILTAPLFDDEPVGEGMLAVLAEAIYGDGDPSRVLFRGQRIEIEDGMLSLSLPLATAAEVELARRGDELLVTAGSLRRSVLLPDTLRGAEVDSASLAGGRLEVRFRRAAVS